MDGELSSEERVYDLFQRGLSDTEGTLGYHGTSIEAVRCLIRDGALPGGENGELYFFGQDEDKFLPRVRDQWERNVKWGVINPIVETHVYANHIAGQHALAKALGLRLNDPRVVERRGFFDEYFDWDVYVEELVLGSKIFGVSSQTFQDIYDDARMHLGVVIGLSVDIQNDVPIHTGDPGEASELKLCLGEQGVRINRITGIHPLGAIERNFLDSLAISFSRD